MFASIDFVTLSTTHKVFAEIEIPNTWHLFLYSYLAIDCRFAKRKNGLVMLEFFFIMVNVGFPACRSTFSIIIFIYFVIYIWLVLTFECLANFIGEPEKESAELRLHIFWTHAGLVLTDYVVVKLYYATRKSQMILCANDSGQRKENGTDRHQFMYVFFPIFGSSFRFDRTHSSVKYCFNSIFFSLLKW